MTAPTPQVLILRLAKQIDAPAPQESLPKCCEIVVCIQNALILTISLPRGAKDLAVWVRQFSNAPSCYLKSTAARSFSLSIVLIDPAIVTASSYAFVISVDSLLSVLGFFPLQPKYRSRTPVVVSLLSLRSWCANETILFRIVRDSAKIEGRSAKPVIRNDSCMLVIAKSPNALLSVCRCRPQHHEDMCWSPQGVLEVPKANVLCF